MTTMTLTVATMFFRIGMIILNTQVKGDFRKTMYDSYYYFYFHFRQFHVPLCRFDFCMAPAQIRDSRMAAALLHFAARYSNGMPATLDIALPDQVPATAEELRLIEATHQVCVSAGDITQCNIAGLRNMEYTASQSGTLYI